MTDKNQGEGDRESARRYNRNTQEDLKGKDVEAKAKAAKRALQGASGEELKQAEKAGKARAKEFDPQVKR